MIKIFIHADTRYLADRKIIRKACKDTFKNYKIEDGNFEISVSVVGARKMRQLSGDYLSDTTTHQILTFALQENPAGPRQVSWPNGQGQAQVEAKGFVNPPDGILRLGEIVLCWPYLVFEAGSDEMMVDDKVYELVCHGVEHLLGYEHG